MSTQLDPVTGAPLLTPDLGNIDQLPYKVQPVPLQDQTNQPQLGRPYLYPDDVPPVLANINAMNGTQPDQAQTLHTDGNHALKVAMSGGGGGGGTTPYGVVASDFDFSTASSFTSDMFCANFIGGESLWRVRVSVGLDSSVDANAAGVWAYCYINSHPHGARHMLGALVFLPRTGFTSGNSCDVQTIDVQFPGGWKNPYFITPGDSEVKIGTFSDWFINVIAASTEWGN